MANKLAGEVEFEVGGKKHVLRLDVNALIAAQAAMRIEDDEAFWGLLLNKLTGSLAGYRAIVYHGLKQTEPEITEEQAGEIITSFGSQKMLAVVAEAIRWALPDQKEAAPTDKGKPRPSAGRKS